MLECVGILVRILAEKIAAEDVKIHVVELVPVIVLGHVDLFVAVGALVTVRMDVKQDVKILALMAVVHALTHVLMRVPIALIHADNRVVLVAKAAVKVAAKQIVPMTVLLIVLRLVVEHVLELMDLKVVQHKTLLKII